MLKQVENGKSNKEDGEQTYGWYKHQFPPIYLRLIRIILMQSGVSRYLRNVGVFVSSFHYSSSVMWWPGSLFLAIKTIESLSISKALSNSSTPSKSNSKWIGVPNSSSMTIFNLPSFMLNNFIPKLQIPIQIPYPKHILF